MFIDDETTSVIISELQLGKSWLELEKFHGFTRSDMQKAVKKYSGGFKDYQALMGYAKKDIIGEEIIVSETGAITLENSPFSTNEAIFVPKFCLAEIKKLYQERPEIISTVEKDERICWMEEPYFKISVPSNVKLKRRSVGVVRLASAIAKSGRKVKIVTTSIEIQNLAVFQKNEKISILKL